ncbi:hypothetical protein SALBM311S_05985 [Streptomyces alboniger]
MIESQVPDLSSVQLRHLLDTEDIALSRGLLWVGMQADKIPAVTASGEGTGGGGAERIG